MSLAGLFSGPAYRIVFTHDTGRVLDGAASAEGRFHFGGLRALYASPKPGWAFRAIEVYLKPDDPERCVAHLEISHARLIDLREPDPCALYGIDPDDAAVPWLPQLARGERPQTWRVTEAVLASGADGFIYTSRNFPLRWHIVLLHWNKPGRPQITLQAWSDFAAAQTDAKSSAESP